MTTHPHLHTCSSLHLPTRVAETSRLPRRSASLDCGTSFRHGRPALPKDVTFRGWDPARGCRRRPTNHRSSLPGRSWLNLPFSRCSVFVISQRQSIDSCMVPTALRGMQPVGYLTNQTVRPSQVYSATRGGARQPKKQKCNQYDLCPVKRSPAGTERLLESAEAARAGAHDVPFLSSRRRSKTNESPPLSIIITHVRQPLQMLSKQSCFIAQSRHHPRAS